MIVRIATEGQYRVQDSDRAAVDELDNLAISASDAGDEARFRQVFSQLLELVRAKGRPVGDDELLGSDLILPPPDATLEEARAEFTGEDLIPG